MPISAPSDLAGLTLWVEPDLNVGGSEGAVVLPWSEADPTLDGADGLDASSSTDAGDGGTWHDDVLCGSQPVIRFTETYNGFEDDFRDSAITPPNLDGVPTYELFHDTDGYYVAGIARAVALPDPAATFFVLSTSNLEIKIADWDGTQAYASLRFRTGDGSGGLLDSVLVDVDPFAYGTWVLIEAWWDGSSAYYRLNCGSVVTVPISGSNLRYNDVGFTMVGVTSGGAFGSGVTAGTICEHGGLVAYASPLTEIERNDVRDYFKTKHSCLVCCDPDPITSVGPTLWVEADSVTGLSSGDLVSPWPESGAIAIDGADDLGAGLPFVFPGAIWATDGPCSSPAMRFEGAEGHGFSTEDREGESNPHSVADNFELYPPNAFTVMAVARVVTFGSATEGTAFWPWFDANSRIELRMGAAATPEVRFFSTQDISGNPITLTHAYTEGDWVCLELWGEGGYATGGPQVDQPGTIHLRVNGGTEVTAPWGGHFQGGQNGCGAVGAQLSEQLALFVFPRALTEGERDALRTGYFACRYPCLDFGGGGEGPPTYVPSFAAIWG